MRLQHTSPQHKMYKRLCLKPSQTQLLSIDLQDTERMLELYLWELPFELLCTFLCCK